MHKLLIAILMGSAILAVVAPNTTRAETRAEAEFQVDTGLNDSEVTPLPRPIDPPSIPGESVNSSTFQLVGFTRVNIDGMQGVLNYTLACQMEFPNSRMCTIDEIRETVSVPRAPGFGYAWVVDPTQSDAANCRGWMSSSASDSGTAIDLSARYGAKGIHECNQPLRIACCAVPSVPTTSCRPYR